MRDFEQFRPYGPVVRNYAAMRFFGALVLLVIVAMLAYLTIVTFRRSRAGYAPAAPAAPRPAMPTVPLESPIDVVKMRYARGEITGEEFEKLKQDLS